MSRPAAPPAARKLAFSIDRSLLFKLVRLVNLAARPFVETLSHAHEITLNEWRALVVLANHPGATSRVVARLTGLDKLSLSGALNALEQQGRLHRDADPPDARRAHWRLTAQGQALFQSIGVLAAERETELFASLPDADRDPFERALDRLVAALDGADAGSEAE